MTHPIGNVSEDADAKEVNVVEGFYFFDRLPRSIQQLLQEHPSCNFSAEDVYFGVDEFGVDYVYNDLKKHAERVWDEYYRRIGLINPNARNTNSGIDTYASWW